MILAITGNTMLSLKQFGRVFIMTWKTFLSKPMRYKSHWVAHMLCPTS